MKIVERLSKTWTVWVVLLALTFSASLPGVFMLPALDRDESRFAQASKQMIESGDYIRLRYQDELRNKKPAGIHWMQAGATAIFSDVKDLEIWSYRIPSWIGACLATLATFWCGLALLSRREAFLGSAMFGTTLLLTSEAHISKTDGMLVFLTTLGMGAIARLFMRQDNDKKMALLFWLAMSLGFLIKGPVTPMVAIFAMVVLYYWNGRDHGWMKSLIWWPGPLLFVVLVLPWFTWIQLATAGEYVQGAVGKDLKDKLVSASEGHGGLPGYHLLHIPAWFFPGSLLFVPMLLLVWHNVKRSIPLRYLQTRLDGRQSDVSVSLDPSRKTVEGLKFLVAWAVPTWIFFELLLTKLSHYILPAYPAFGLLCGYVAVQIATNANIKSYRIVSVIVFGLGGLGLALLSNQDFLLWLFRSLEGDSFKSVDADTVFTAWKASSPQSIQWLWYGASVVTAVSCLMYLFRKVNLAIGAGILASVLFGWHIRAFFLPNQLWIQPTETARAALMEVCGVPDRPCEKGLETPERIVAFGYAEPSYIMTMGTQNLHPPESVAELPSSETGFPAVYLINAEKSDGIPAFNYLSDRAEQQGRRTMVSKTYYAWNYSDGELVAFTALRVE